MVAVSLIGFLSNIFMRGELQWLTDSPQRSIHGTPSMEVTHISLRFKLSVDAVPPLKTCGSLLSTRFQKKEPRSLDSKRLYFGISCISASIYNP